jgi:hypothetical protein
LLLTVEIAASPTAVSKMARTTRSSAATASAAAKPYDRPAQTQNTKATRSSRKKAEEPAAETPAPTTTKRRLRSTKAEDASPLRKALPEPVGRKKATAKGKGKANAPAKEQSPDMDRDDGSDPDGSRIYFKSEQHKFPKSFKQDVRVSIETTDHFIEPTDYLIEPTKHFIEPTTDDDSFATALEHYSSPEPELSSFPNPYFSPITSQHISPIIKPEESSQPRLPPVSLSESSIIPSQVQSSYESLDGSRIYFRVLGEAPRPPRHKVGVAMPEVRRFIAPADGEASRETPLSPEASQALIQALQARIAELNTRNAELERALTVADTQSNYFQEKSHDLEDQYTNIHKEHINLSTQYENVSRENSDIRKGLHIIQNSAQGVAERSKDAFELENLVAAVAESRPWRFFQRSRPQEEEEEATAQSSQTHVANSPASTPATPKSGALISLSPSTPLPPPQPSTPRSFSLFGFSFSSPFSKPSAPIQAPPTQTTQTGPANPVQTSTSTPIRSPEADLAPLTMALMQAPTPVGEARPKKKRKINNRNRIIRKVTASVAEDEKDKAKAWVESSLKKMMRTATNDALLGDKRKRLEKGVKVGDLKTIQGTKPWHQGSFGLDDEIADLSDSDEAPAWAVLQDILLEAEADMQAPPAKRRKPFRPAPVEDVPSLNETFAASPAPVIFNSKGKSTSIYDLQPRRSIDPPPMFDNAVHREGSNVFNELQQTSAEQSNTVRDSVPTTISSFSVPEGDSDEDEGEGASWTQQPPPAPVPAHASLPAVLDDTQHPQDPVEHQRAKATKYTPAKPSRLREIHVPSPSLLSDAGGSPIPAGAVQTGMGIPDAEMLDLPEDVQAYMNQYISSGQMEADIAANQWDDLILSYSDDE